VIVASLYNSTCPGVTWYSASLFTRYKEKWDSSYPQV